MTAVLPHKMVLQNGLFFALQFNSAGTPSQTRLQWKPIAALPRQGLYVKMGEKGPPPKALLRLRQYTTVHGALAGDQRRNILTVEAHNRKLNTLNVRRLCRSSKNTHLIHFTSKQAPITYTAHTYRQCMQNPYRFTFLSAFFAQEMQDNDD